MPTNPQIAPGLYTFNEGALMENFFKIFVSEMCFLHGPVCYTFLILSYSLLQSFNFFCALWFLVTQGYLAPIEPKHIFHQFLKNL